MSDRLRACRISAEPLSPERLRTLVSDPVAGAEVVFCGTVRNHDGRPEEVTGLRYEAHPSAPAELERVSRAVLERHDVVAAAAEHRVGDLRVGDVAVVVAVSAAHRAEAFAAASELIDTLKREVPIWKHQSFADGSDAWVGL